MATVYVRFDARQLKSDIQDAIEQKIRAVTTNSLTYEELLWAFQEAMAEELPVDTGALAYGDSGISENGYRRYGDIHIANRSLAYNPIEVRPDYDKAYAQYVIKDEHIKNAEDNPQFHEAATEILTRRMKDE